ncbi:MAG: bifunctional folylpolyglutamate synthase/dihydrofolate synthase, partial [Lachnospiraceae bacterium]|nr:bifunctional folylpolyglutamate synthase/dihydrofolate synthase [Lachnospiraceae bacterium]
MNYRESIDYLNSISNPLKKTGLKGIEETLISLGSPQDGQKYIHVAGTNGKGSVCAMLSSVFTEAGYKTGLFTSPHLIRYNERMKINGVDISDYEFAELLTRVVDSSKAHKHSMGVFESLTAAALLWFSEKECDIVILEVGLGGEFDFTNVIKEKELAVITPIGFDHTAILGNTLSEIAEAKAGILKNTDSAVLALQYGYEIVDNRILKSERDFSDEEIMKVIRERCELRNISLHIPRIQNFRLISESLEGEDFLSDYIKEPIRLNLIGKYQLFNALTVLEVIEILRNKNWKLPKEALLRGLGNAKWPARFELLHKDPVFILDGAHNGHGVNACVDSLISLFASKKIVYILGMLNDKD